MINSTTTNATTTNLRVSGTSALGTVAAGTWNGTAIGLAYGGTGADTSAYSSGLLGLTTGTMTDVDSEAEFETIMGSDYLTVTASDITSANLATILSDETGTGSVVFSDSPTFTGSAQFAGLRVTASSTLGYASSTALTVSGTSYLNFASSTNASTTGLTAQNAYLSALTLGTTAGVLTTNTSGVVSASSTIGDSYITDALTVSGGTIGSNNISGTLTTTGTLTIGDNGDVINIDSSTWDVTSGAFTGITNLSVTGSSTIGGGTGTTGLTINGNATTTGNSYIAGNVSIGTTSASAHLTIDASGLTGSIVGGMKQYLGFINSTLSALYYGDETYITNVPTATSTLVGKMIRIADTSALGNTIRGLEVQAHRGTNTKGENTGLSGFGRTFGVRGSTMGDAGDTYLPAGMFAETEGTTQGNALRAYSGTITSENLVYFFQDTSNFTGTGLKMDFGNAGGSFAATSTAKFLDFKVNGTSKFYVSANGSTTIGDGTVSASLRIPYGGICVDNDGSCVSTTTGQIRSVTSALGNSDLAEMYFSNQSLRTGEIVSLAGGLSVKRANSDTEENIIGVVSTKPGMTLGFDDSSLAQGETGYPVGLKGRVPVRLSIENGVIHKGDRIALSSISGVGMKAHEGDRIVGIALEDFDGTKAYSAGFLNQFGDDMVKERVVAVREMDVHAQDGCYNGGGNALGEAECEERTETPLTLPSVNPEKTRAEMLAELRNTGPESATGENGETYAVGQAIMFIELAWYQDSAERMVLSELATTTPLEGGGTTLWDRIKTLATNFVDGVLSVTGIKADRVEVKDELCVDGVCVTADDLRAILESTRGGAGTGGGATGGDETGGGEVTGGVETPVEPNPPTLPEPTSTPTEEPPVVEEPTPEAPTEPEAPQEPAPQPEPSPAPSEPTV